MFRIPSSQEYLTDITYAKIAECQNLEELHIYGGFYYGDFEELTHQALANIETLPNLKRIYFLYWDQDGLAKFFQNTRSSLTEVEFTDCYFSEDSDDVVAAITKNNRELRHLKFHRCTNLSERTMWTIMENCGRLVSLELDWELIPSDCVLEIPRKMSELKRLVLLHGNKIRGYSKSEVTISGLCELAKRAPHLNISDV